MADTLQVQGQDWYLAGSGVNLSQTTVTILNFYLPDNITPVTMAMFGPIGYMTLEPESSREENISFTGITNNGNGTWTLTGVTRGLGFVFPGTQVLALRYAHAGGTKIRATNSFQFYETLYANKTRDQVITGSTWVFNATADAANPKIDDINYVPAADDYIVKQFVDDTYLRLDGTNSPMTGPVDFGAFNITNLADGVALQDAVTLSQLQAAVIAGALPATDTIAGIVLIATQADWDNTVDTETIGPNTYYNIPPISMIQNGIGDIVQNFINSATSVSKFDDFLGGKTETIDASLQGFACIGELNWTYFSSVGSTNENIQHVDGTTGRPGIIRISSGGTNAIAGIVLGSSSNLTVIAGNALEAGATSTNTSIGPMNQGNWSLTASYLPEATTDIVVEFGLVANTEIGDLTPNDGIFFRLDTAVDANWHGVCRAAGVESTIGSVAATTAFKKFEIIQNAAGTSVEFLIDGVSLGSIATNIPSSQGIPMFTFSPNTATNRYIEIDYWWLTMTTAAR